jgi:hypothetical protein
MKRAIILTLLFTLGLAGCVSSPSTASILSKSEFQKKFDENATKTAYWQYMGDRDGFHFIRLVSAFGQKVYRVHESELPIKNVFPLTDDSTRWPMVFPDGRTASMDQFTPKAKHD